MGKVGIISRAVGVLSAVTVLGAGVTYASLTTSASLTGNTLASATAGLVVDGSDADTTANASEAGFAFTGLLPGGGFSDPQTFKLENTGSSNLKVTVYSTVGSLTGVLNKNKVFFQFANSGGGTPVTYTLAQMEANYNGLPGVSGTGESLLPDNPATEGTNEGAATFTVKVKMDEDAVSGGSASLANFDMVFTGTAVAPAAV